MTREEIKSKLVLVVSNQFGCPEDEVSIDDRFREDLFVDSLDAVELTMEVEDEFEISVPDEEWEKVLTIKDAIDLIERQLK